MLNCEDMERCIYVCHDCASGFALGERCKYEGPSIMNCRECATHIAELFAEYMHEVRKDGTMQSKSVYKRENIQSGKNCGTCIALRFPMFGPKGYRKQGKCGNPDSEKFYHCVSNFDSCNKWEGRNNDNI